MSADPSAKPFPKIPFMELYRLSEECEIPARSRKNPRSLGAWKLAKSLKGIEAGTKLEDRIERAGHHVEKSNPAKSDTWLNIVDYLTAALESRDFTVIDEFSKAWGTWEIKSEVFAASEDGKLMKSIEVTNRFKQSPKSYAILHAVMRLQGKLEAPDRAPSYQEIHKMLAEMQAEPNFTGCIVDETELSKQIKILGLAGRIPKARDLVS